MSIVVVAAAAVYQDRVSLSVQPGRSWNSLCIGILFCLICFVLLFLFPPIWLFPIVSLAVLKGNAPILQAGPDPSVSRSHGIYIPTTALMAVRDRGTFFSLRLVHYSKPRKATRCSPSMPVFTALTEYAGVHQVCRREYSKVPAEQSKEVGREGRRKWGARMRKRWEASEWSPCLRLVRLEPTDDKALRPESFQYQKAAFHPRAGQCSPVQSHCQGVSDLYRSRGTIIRAQKWNLK